MNENVSAEQIGSVSDNEELRGVIVNAVSLSEKGGEGENTEETQADETNENETKIVSENQDVGEQGASESEESGQETAGTEEAEETVDEGQASGVEAPEHWASDDREMFSKQTPEAKDWLLGIYKGMESAHTKRSQEIAPMRNVTDQWSGYLNNVGVRPEQMFNSLMQVESALRTGTVEQKRGTVLKIAQEYGIPLNIESELEDDNHNPERDMMMAENYQLRQNNQMAQQNNSTVQVRDRISQFKSETDIQGNLKHPYFDELESDMAQLAQVDQVNGKVSNLSELYENATWANSTVREKVLNGQKSINLKQQEKERQEKLAKAKKAGSSISTGNTNSQKPSEPKTVEQEVRALMNV